MNNNEIIVNITGNSMLPVIFPKTEYTFKTNISSMKREDIVLLHRKYYLVKFLKGLPNDKITFQKDGDTFFNILINDKILKTTKNEPYTIKNKRKNFLEGWGNIILKDMYFCLGNIKNGSEDSIRVGYFSKDQIKGILKDS